MIVYPYEIFNRILSAGSRAGIFFPGVSGLRKSGRRRHEHGSIDFP
jgi:hypothetical protein